MAVANGNSLGFFVVLYLQFLFNGLVFCKYCERFWPLFKYVIFGEQSHQSVCCAWWIYMTLLLPACLFIPVCEMYTFTNSYTTSSTSYSTYTQYVKYTKTLKWDYLLIKLDSKLFCTLICPFVHYYGVDLMFCVLCCLKALETPQWFRVQF